MNNNNAAYDLNYYYDLLYRRDWWVNILNDIEILIKATNITHYYIYKKYRGYMHWIY